MKAEEIRNVLKTWKKEDIVKLYTQTYRRVPKAAKEELDLVIRNGMGSGTAAVQKKKDERRDIRELEQEIDIFIERATEGLYYYANRTVSKKERSNWRFTVKRMIKELMSYTPEDIEYDKSNVLLCHIYDILGRAAGFYTFASQDPYHTVGYESQPQFFREICQRVDQSPTDEAEPWDELITVGCNGQNDPETVDDEIHAVLLELFETPEQLKWARETTEELFQPIRDKYEKNYKDRFSGFVTEDEIITRNKYTSFLWFITAVHMKEGDLAGAYDYVMKSKPNHRDEVTLYCLLQNYASNEEEWRKLYEMGLDHGIEPREMLRKKYEEIVNEGKN